MSVKLSYITMLRDLSEMKSPTLVIRWAESESPRYNWFIRGLRPDGSFYGEVRSTFDTPRATDGAAGVGRSIEGQLDRDDMERVAEFAAQIRTHPAPDTDLPVNGVLADGPIGDPIILYRHPNSSDSDATEPFLGIIEILRPHLAHHYSSLS